MDTGGGNKSSEMPSTVNTLEKGDSYAKGGGVRSA